MKDTYTKQEVLELCRTMAHDGIYAMPDKDSWLRPDDYTIRVNITYAWDGFDALLAGYGLRMYDMYIGSDVLACCRL